ncbi:hypothetical protein JAF86_002134 [Citrobacter braakii]|jgi:hypothetical protein|uniref:hypothetical protein n=1 Tax=Citrobacter braakii TaxID=57706 RepID=UPI001C9406F8|nr:hypothetical protein [Citrobacter braakii]EGT0676375.1 hypothetical protein [Citrobacter braakii]MBY5201814.1 hypothetical protein [Citrobacter braakii]
MTEPFRHECRVAHIIMLQSAQERLRRAFFTVFLHVDLKLLNAFFWQWQRFRHPALPDHSFMWAEAQKSPVISGGAKAWSYLTV